MVYSSSQQHFLRTCLIFIIINAADQQRKVTLVDKTTPVCKSGLLADTDVLAVEVTLELHSKNPFQHPFEFHLKYRWHAADTRICTVESTVCPAVQISECYCETFTQYTRVYFLSVQVTEEMSQNVLFVAAYDNGTRFTQDCHVIPTVYGKIKSETFKIDGGDNLLSNSTCSQDRFRFGEHQFEYCVVGLNRPRLTIKMDVLVSHSADDATCVVLNATITKESMLHIHLNYTDDCRRHAYRTCVVTLYDCWHAELKVPVSIRINEGRNLFLSSQCSEHIAHGQDHILKFCGDHLVHGYLSLSNDAGLAVRNISHTCIVERFKLDGKSSTFLFEFTDKCYGKGSYTCVFHGTAAVPANRLTTPSAHNKHKYDAFTTWIKRVTIFSAFLGLATFAYLVYAKRRAKKATEDTDADTSKSGASGRTESLKGSGGSTNAGTSSDPSDQSSSGHSQKADDKRDVAPSVKPITRRVTFGVATRFSIRRIYPFKKK